MLGSPVGTKLDIRVFMGDMGGLVLLPPTPSIFPAFHILETY
jgi:hypothetical protein